MNARLWLCLQLQDYNTTDVDRAVSALTLSQWDCEAIRTVSIILDQLRAECAGVEDERYLEEKLKKSIRGHVYVVQLVGEGEDLYKVGRTSDWRRRLQTFRRQWAPLGIKPRLVHRIGTPDSIWAEQEMHRMLGEVRVGHKTTIEAFILDADQLAKLKATKELIPDWYRRYERKLLERRGKKCTTL